MSFRTVARVHDHLLAELTPDAAKKLLEDLVPTARDRFPYCDLTVQRNDYRSEWIVVAHGYIDGVATVPTAQLGVRGDS